MLVDEIIEKVKSIKDREKIEIIYKIIKSFSFGSLDDCYSVCFSVLYALKYISCIQMLLSDNS